MTGLKLWPTGARPDLVVWPETMWRWSLLEIDAAREIDDAVVTQWLGPALAAGLTATSRIMPVLLSFLLKAAVPAARAVAASRTQRPQAAPRARARPEAGRLGAARGISRRRRHRGRRRLERSFARA